MKRLFGCGDARLKSQNSGESVMAKATTGKQLISAAWAALKQDKELMVLPVLGGVFSAIAVGLITGIGWVAGAFTSMAASSSSGSTTNINPIAYMTAALVAYVSTTIALFFQAAVISGAMQRLDGGNPTIGSSLSAASKKLGPIMLWALIATTVGLILRALSERGGIFSKIASALAGMAWAVATFFVLPIVIFEGTNSFAAVKRSGQLISQRWGSVARTNIRFGFQVFLAVAASIGAIVWGIGLAISSSQSGTGLSPAVGSVIALFGVVALTAIIVITNALSGYVRAVLYRHAVGKPVPGVSQEILAGAFPMKS